MVAPRFAAHSVRRLCSQVSTCAFLLLAQKFSAQFYLYPGDYHSWLLTEKNLAAKDSSLHTGMKPCIPFFSQRYTFQPDTTTVFKYIKDDPGIDFVFKNHFIDIKSREDNSRLRLDPLLNLETGKDFADETRGRLYTNTRGFVGSGSVGNSFYFETMLAENQSLFPRWLSVYDSVTGIVPGQGRWKTFKVNGYDYAFAAGMVSVQLSSHLNVQAGHGKHKVGYGYRSLLLSDNAFNYPYVRFTQQWMRGRLQYQNIYALLTNLVPASKVIPANAERLFQKKPASFQYLSYNPSRSLNIGLFQGIVWKPNDGKNRARAGWNFLNPLIFSQAASYGLDGENNVLLGGDFRWKLTDRINVYGQYMLDSQKEGASGFQAGFNFFDLFGVRNLAAQVEYNDAGTGAYKVAAGSSPGSSWSHYNQPLAYTPGEGKEFIALADYRVKRTFFSARYHRQEHANGSNARSYVDVAMARIGWVINPTYNLNISVGLLYRKGNFSNFISSNESGYVFIALRTSLYNLYYDF